MARNRPADIILDLLLGVPTPGRSAAYLVDACRLFGISENTARVTLSRLLSRKIIESGIRGHYHLAEHSNHIDQFVRRWRLGERRVKQWRSKLWLMTHLSGARKADRWALESLGFRELDTNLFVRPDNLATTVDALKTTALGLGLTEKARWLRGQTADDGEEEWASLWDTEALNSSYRDLTERLQRSSQRLASLSNDDARLESFNLGGEAVHTLAKDPLLPDGLVDASARRLLWQEMRAYEQLGLAAWGAAKHEQQMPAPRLVPTP